MNTDSKKERTKLGKQPEPISHESMMLIAGYLRGFSDTDRFDLTAHDRNLLRLASRIVLEAAKPT